MSLLVFSSGCEKPAQKPEIPPQEPKAAETIPDEQLMDITEIRVQVDYEFDPLNIRSIEGDGPRLLCSARALSKFSQPRDSLRFRELMRYTQGYWERYGKKRVDDPVAPAYMALAAHLTGNDTYKAIAFDLILSAASSNYIPGDSSEQNFWAAIGYDFIKQKLEQTEREMLETAALDRVRMYLLPTVINLPNTYPEDTNWTPPGAQEAYLEAFLWEMVCTTEQSRLEEILINAGPVLYQAWWGASENWKGFEDRWYKDPLWFAIKAWEYNSVAKIISMDSDGPELIDLLEKNRSDEISSEDFMQNVNNIAKWEFLLDGDNLVEYEGYLDETGYSPEALIHLAVKMDMRDLR